MHNSKYQCHMAACCAYHRPTNFSQLLNRSHTKKRKKTNSLTKKYWRIFWGKNVRRMSQQAEKGKTESTDSAEDREEIVNWNQMTALRFQAGGRHQTSPAFLRGCYWCKKWHWLREQRGWKGETTTTATEVKSDIDWESRGVGKEEQQPLLLK